MTPEGLRTLEKVAEQLRMLGYTSTHCGTVDKVVAPGSEKEDIKMGCCAKSWPVMAVARVLAGPLVGRRSLPEDMVGEIWDKWRALESKASTGRKATRWQQQHQGLVAPNATDSAAKRWCCFICAWRTPEERM